MMGILGAKPSKEVPSKEESLKTIGENLSDEALAVLARLSKKKGVGKKLIDNEGKLNLFL